MRRTIISIFLMLVGAATLFANTGKAEVVSFTGKAEYQTAQGWEPLAVGTVLDQGTVISTGFKSSVVLAIGESRYTVAALSRITIDKLTENDSNYDTEMSLSTGKLKMDVKSRPGKSTAFTVRSPTATASVRGTSGILDVTGNLQSLTGTWSMAANTPNSKPILVSGTQSAKITEPQKIETPQQTAQSNATIAVSTTTSLAASEEVAVAGVVATTPAPVVPPVATPVAAPALPATGSIEVTIQLPK